MDTVGNAATTDEEKRRVASAGLAASQREVAVRCEPWAESGVMLQAPSLFGVENRLAEGLNRDSFEG